MLHLFFIYLIIIKGPFFLSVWHHECKCCSFFCKIWKYVPRAKNHNNTHKMYYRDAGVGGGQLPQPHPSVFVRSVNPIRIRGGGRFCLQYYCPSPPKKKNIKNLFWTMRRLCHYIGQFFLCRCISTTSNEIRDIKFCLNWTVTRVIPNALLCKWLMRYQSTSMQRPEITRYLQMLHFT